jgi:hypothetical protein
LATYLFRLVGGANDASTHIHHECDDDLKALDKAYELCANFDVEVWRDQRLVCKVRQGRLSSYRQNRAARTSSTTRTMTGDMRASRRAPEGRVNCNA